MEPMAHQQEYQPNVNEGGHSTPAQEPIDTTENPNIVRGEDSYIEQPGYQTAEEREIARKEVAANLELMFDDYIAAKQSTADTYTYISGYDDDYRTADGAERRPIYSSIPMEDIVKARNEDLHKYVKGALLADNLVFDPTIFQEKGRDIRDMDGLSQAYIDRGIKRAEARYDAKTSKYPAHISVEAEDIHPEITHKFTDIVRNLGYAAVHAITAAGTIISGPINLMLATPEIRQTTPPQVEDDRTLLNDPKHAAEVTQAINLRTIKPEDLGIKV